jgi:hypothetical protein
VQRGHLRISGHYSVNCFLTLLCTHSIRNYLLTVSSKLIHATRRSRRRRLSPGPTAVSPHGRDRRRGVENGSFPCSRSDGEMHPTLGDFSLLPLAAAKLRRAHEAAAKITGTGLCDSGAIRTVKTLRYFWLQIAQLSTVYFDRRKPDLSISNIYFVPRYARQPALSPGRETSTEQARLGHAQ